MLNFKKIIGIAAIIAVIGMAFFSCEEEKPGLVPGVPSAPKVQGNAPDFATDNSSNVSASGASALFSELLTNISSFGIADALDDAVEEGDFTTTGTILNHTTSGKFNDASSAAFKTALVTAGLPNDKNATVKGSYDKSYNYDLSSNTWTLKESDKSNLTATISGLITNSSNKKLGGVVYVSGSGSTSTTYDVQEGNTKGKMKGNGKCYATVTYFNGTVGAKFRFSYSLGESATYKATKTEGGASYSDVEVYGNDNLPITTLYSTAFGSFFNTFVPF